MPVRNFKTKSPSVNKGNRFLLYQNSSKLIYKFGNHHGVTSVQYKLNYCLFAKHKRIGLIRSTHELLSKRDPWRNH